jgi:alpha-glucoside transport system substrate-binding protein
MAINFKTLGAAAVASFTLAGVASADVCDTPSKLGDLGRFDGEVVTIAGSITGQDEDQVLNTIGCFEKATGAKVEYSGSRDFAALIVADLRSNNAPNVAIFPQPGLAADLAKEGLLVPLGDETAAWMASNYGAGKSWADLGNF